MAKKQPLTNLMRAALISAKKSGHDVFNCLNIMDNKKFLEVSNVRENGRNCASAQETAT